MNEVAGLSMSERSVDYAHFLGTLVKGMCAKYRREIILTYSLESGGYHVAKNNSETLIKDVAFKRKLLDSNIKNHLPAKIYNLLLMTAASDPIYAEYMKLSGWDVAELMLETIVHNENISSLIIKITKGGIEGWGLGCTPKEYVPIIPDFKITFKL